MPSYARKHQLQRSLFYHVYNRSYRGEFIFKQRRDFKHFSDLLFRLKEKGGIDIYHWVIMSNHYHLCVRLKEPETISGMISGLQRAYTHYYNHTRKTAGYLWQGRFKSQPVEGERYLLACGRYIERNPVRAGMVKRAEDHPFSSASYYCLGQDDKITAADPYYDDFGKTVKEKQKQYRCYLGKFDNKEEERNFASPIAYSFV